MALARVGVELVTGPAVAAAKKLQQSVGKVEAEIKKLLPTNRRVQASFRLMGMKAKKAMDNVKASADKARRALGGLKGLIGGLAIGFTAVQAAQAGIARAESERRIKFLARSYGEMAELQAAATASAEKFGLSQTEANSALANTYARLRPVGVSLKDITSIYNGFNTVAKLSGANSVEASNAFTQLAQALGSGALRGDEFNSIAEQVPGLLTAISKETGAAQGSLRAYAAEGKITSDIVLKALKRIETEGAEQLTEALGGPAQAVKEFQNATEDVQVALTDAVIPELSEAFRELAQIIKDLEPAIRGVGEIIALTLKDARSMIEFVKTGGAVQRARSQAENAAFEATRKKFGGRAFGKRGARGADVEAFFEGRLQTELARRVGLAQGIVPGQLPPSAAILPGAEVPTGTTPFGPLKGSGGRSGRGSRQAKERVDASRELLELNQRLFGSTEQLSELEKISLRFQIKKQEILDSNLTPRRQEIQLLEAAAGFEKDLLGYREDQLEEAQKAQKEFNDFFKAEQEAAQKRLEADPFFQMKQQLEELVKLENQVAAGATAIGSAFANSFRSVIDGSKSGQEALADMMSSIAEHFMDMATQIIAQQLAMILYGTIMKALGVSLPGAGGGGPSPVKPFFEARTPGLAEGGFVDRPMNALIGEGGEPEYVIPESKMRESMARYSRGSRGASVIPEGSGGAADENGGTAVAAPIDVRYTVERINSVDYVTADQFQRGMQSAATQGAKQGEQNTLKRLQMSGSTRKRLGL